VADLHAAKRAGVDVERFRSWEAGEARPSVAQLRHLADLYKRPLVFFFLDEVPQDFAVMKAFRRLPLSEDEEGGSHQLAIQTRQALVRREIYLNLAGAGGWEVPRFPLAAGPRTDPAEAGARARQALGVRIEQQVRWGDERQAFKSWREAVESMGVLTFQVSRVSVEEMRGLSAWHDVLPVILVNSADTLRGRIFTLLHELGHLVLHQDHLCDWNGITPGQKSAAEIWCNAFAASVLVPEDALLRAYRRPENARQRLTPDWEEARRLADRFKVSQEVVLRRLAELRQIPKSAYAMARSRLVDAPVPKQKGESKGGPSRDVVAIWNLGVPFVRTVLEAMHQRAITLAAASDFLDVKVKHIPAIERRLQSGILDDAPTGP
jgi:Zn-dependent peptidase ImmA (M78 family)/transcriptional regulator with XRE-family HTH domain